MCGQVALRQAPDHTPKIPLWRLRGCKALSAENEFSHNLTGRTAFLQRLNLTKQRECTTIGLPCGQYNPLNNSSTSIVHYSGLKVNRSQRFLRHERISPVNSIGGKMKEAEVGSTKNTPIVNCWHRRVVNKWKGPHYPDRLAFKNREMWIPSAPTQ